MSGCLSPNKIIVSQQIYNPEGIASLKTAQFTYGPQATISLACELKTTHYIQSTTLPLRDDPGWISCPASRSDIQQALIPGENNLKYWFKTNQGIIDSISKDVFVKQGAGFIFNSPGPSSSGAFGSNVKTISATHYAVNEVNYSAIQPSAGAVHVYNHAGSLIYSITGDNANDNLGSGGITSLPNGNYLIRSEFDDVNGVVDASSVKLINGVTGEVIATIAGDVLNDNLGNTGFTNLPNGNFLIRSEFDDVDGVVDASSVTLVNGTSGAVIATLAGDDTGDKLGNSGITLLPNGNFLIRSSVDDVDGVINASTVKLINGTTGTVINTFAGDVNGDSIGSGGFKFLPNGYFIISSSADDVGGLVNAGSVILVDSDGALKKIIAGDDANDSLGVRGTILLSNGNFVILSSADRIGGVSSVGSVKFVNGTSGDIIKTIVGDALNDSFGYSHKILPNGNFIIYNEYDDDVTNGVVDAGLVILFDGASGEVIKTFVGDESNDQLGREGIFILPDGNFAIISKLDNVNGVTDAGSVILVNSFDGEVIKTIAGDNLSDNLGSSGITSLPNGNIAIISTSDDVNGISNAGSVTIVNSNPAVANITIAGNDINDSFGFGGIKLLKNGNFVIISQFDNVAPVASASSLTLVNGTTGAVINTVAGDVFLDSLGAGLGALILSLPNGDFIAQTRDDDDITGIINASSIMLIDGVTGLVKIKLSGDVSGDNLGGIDSFSRFGTTILPNGNIVIRSYLDDVDGRINAGSVVLLKETGEIIRTFAGDVANDNLGGSGITVLPSGNFIIRSHLDDVDGIIDAGSIMHINGTTGAVIATITGNKVNDRVGLSEGVLISNDLFLIGLTSLDVAATSTAGAVALFPVN